MAGKWLYNIKYLKDLINSEEKYVPNLKEAILGDCPGIIVVFIKYSQDSK